MKELEYVRRKIRDSGYLSALQIVLRLAKRRPGINKNELESILSTLSSCNDIHKIAYTNSYVSTLKLKDLYYYNPSNQKTPKRKKKTSAKKNKSVLHSS